MELQPLKTSVELMSTRDAKPGKELEYWREAGGGHCPMSFNALDKRQFHGDAALAQIGELRLTELSTGPFVAKRTAELVSRDTSDVARLGLVTSGAVEYRQEDKVIRLVPGTGVFCDSAHPYEMLNRENVRLLMLQIPYVRIPGGEKSVSALINRDLARTSELFPLVAAYITQLATRIAHLDERAASLVGRNLADLVCAMVTMRDQLQLDLPGHTTAARLRVRAFIEQHLANPDLDPALVSKALRLSPRYINKLLEVDGISLGRLIWQCRLERIAADLRNPALAQNSISTIALRHGFSDLSHFSRSFRRCYGDSPRGYRFGAR